MRAAVKIRAASTYLTCFGAPKPANDPHEATIPTDAPVETVEGAPEPQPQAETPATWAQAEPPTAEKDDSSAADLAAEIERRVAAAREEERQVAEERLLQARQSWTNDIAVVLAGQIDQAINAAFDVIREDVARTLTPFVSREIFGDAFDQALACIKKGLGGAAEPVIEIFAPVDLIEKLKHALADRNIAIIAHESDQTEMRIQMGATVIETALEEWLSHLTNNGKGVS